MEGGLAPAATGKWGPEEGAADHMKQLQLGAMLGSPHHVGQPGIKAPSWQSWRDE